MNCDSFSLKCFHFVRTDNVRDICIKYIHYQYLVFCAGVSSSPVTFMDDDGRKQNKISGYRRRTEYNKLKTSKRTLITNPVGVQTCR